MSLVKGQLSTWPYQMNPVPLSLPVSPQLFVVNNDWEHPQNESGQNGKVGRRGKEKNADLAVRAFLGRAGSQMGHELCASCAARSTHVFPSFSS